MAIKFALDAAIGNDKTKFFSGIIKMSFIAQYEECFSRKTGQDVGGSVASTWVVFFSQQYN